MLTVLEAVSPVPLRVTVPVYVPAASPETGLISKVLLPPAATPSLLNADAPTNVKLVAPAVSVTVTAPVGFVPVLLTVTVCPSAETE